MIITYLLIPHLQISRDSDPFSFFNFEPSLLGRSPFEKRDTHSGLINMEVRKKPRRVKRVIRKAKKAKMQALGSFLSFYL